MDIPITVPSATITTGLTATLVMDLASLARHRLAGTPLPNYGLVGRWLAHCARGRCVHAAIAAAPAVRHERALGWIAHYLTGIAFAGLLAAFAGAGWFSHPTFLPAFATGLATVAAPFLLMQPGMGAGIAASRALRPWAARRQSLVTHAVFGVGLYVGGWVARGIAPQ